MHWPNSEAREASGALPCREQRFRRLSNQRPPCCVHAFALRVLGRIHLVHSGPFEMHDACEAVERRLTHGISLGSNVREI